jgi:hypothetical protein
MMIAQIVAALYIDPRGPYPRLLGPEMCWDETRDARTYDGPWPVIAHPPCAPWTTLRNLCRRDAEKIHGAHAVDVVQRFGGVLEQPAGSKLFEMYGLPLPGHGRDADDGESYEVEQVAWGHVARKKTWLYVVGVPSIVVLRGILTGGTATHWCSASHKPGDRGETPPGIKVCSAQQRRRTPVAFAEWLIEIARNSVTDSPGSH